jgi:hypothetical protein
VVSLSRYFCSGEILKRLSFLWLSSFFLLNLGFEPSREKKGENETHAETQKKKISHVKRKSKINTTT